MNLSVSKIRTFKACRRLYQLHYVEKLSPIKKSEATEIGATYHKLIEELYTGKNSYDFVGMKENAMILAYQKYILPKLNVVETEKRVEYNLGDGDKLIGYVDGITDAGEIVEHKTCSTEITEQYEYDLLWDEQILAYMLMTGQRKVWYTACRKPNIRQKQNESDEDFYSRMVEWYDEDTEKKIRLFEIERTDKEVEDFLKQVYVMKDTMKRAEKEKNFYKNTLYCTRWGQRCEYSPVCLYYDPEQSYVDFLKE